MKLALLVLIGVVGCALAQIAEEDEKAPRTLALPVPGLCAQRPKQWQFGNHNYFFSGDQREFTKGGKPAKVDWLGARNVCRRRCMDAVSMETERENQMIFDFVRDRNLSYIWTSGRLCDFDGCAEREDLHPTNIFGWFWSGTNTKMSPTNKTPAGWRGQPWSNTGHEKRPQPDNAEARINQTPESCMGVLNNIYQDGIKWHDIACYHKKPFICEDNDDLLNFIAHENPSLRL
ncbi:C-type lectin domain-containing protein slf [Oratosquilla oratoria]|uniref:C-type lectin domain-containing protein slf n=1 Tax=Oratosquilla oratoria TaxID=337810 RepID=UPI003F770FE1